MARAKPGTLNYASSGPGSNYHMSAELLKNLTGVDIVHVPYRGSTGARQDIVGGQVQMMLDSVPSMVPLISGGNVRALAVTGKGPRTHATRKISLLRSGDRAVRYNVVNLR